MGLESLIFAQNPLLKRPSYSFQETLGIRVEGIQAERREEEVLQTWHQKFQECLSGHPFDREMLPKTKDLGSLTTIESIACFLNQPPSLRCLLEATGLWVPEIEPLIEAVKKARDPEERLDALEGAIRAWDGPPKNLAPFIRFRLDDRKRNYLWYEGDIEMILLCWAPGHMTEIHNHGRGVVGVDYVVKGSFEEYICKIGEEGGRRGLERTGVSNLLNPGEMTRISAQIYHQVKSSQYTPSISFNAYAPCMNLNACQGEEF